MRPRKHAGPRKPTRSLQRLIGKYVVIAALLVLVPFLLMFGMEWIQRGSISDTWEWLRTAPELAGLNMLLAGLAFFVLYAAVGSLTLAAGLGTLVLMLVSLVSYFKLKLIGEPLFPWDLFLNKESMNILPLVTSREALLRLGVVIGIAVALFLSRLWLPKLSLRPITRAALGLLSLLALYSFGMHSAWAAKLTDKAGFNEIAWNQKENYGINGLSLAFTMNVKNTIVPKPPGYSEDSMTQLADSLSELVGSGTASAAAPQKKPNVIFIMNEAFWDPTLLPDVTFSEDPLPTVHQLQKESTSGYLLSPQFGGGTSNVEFEVLSGQSMSFLPAGSVPYQQYITKPLPSLASYFKSQGYKSTAIHSYEGWFWNRQEVYKQMGFDSFKSKEAFENPEYKGTFISDDEVSRSIVKEVEDNPEPTFIYAVTMQNHGPYDDKRYGQNSLSVSGQLTPEARDTLETYTHGVRDADSSLKLLIDHFEQSDEPTVIVFYGDHLPMLGYDYDVYKQAGFIRTAQSDKWSLDELKKMHSVPFVVWSNTDLPKEQVPTLSNSFLSAYMLDRLQLPLPAAWAFNGELAKRTPGLLRNLVVDSGQTLYPSVPPSVQEDVEKYRKIQYDELFGKQYLAKHSEGIEPPVVTRSTVPGQDEFRTAGEASQREEIAH